MSYVSPVEPRETVERCPSCDGSVALGQRFCPACGTSLDVADSPTGTAPRRVVSPSGSPSPRGSALRTARGAASAVERFAPGTVLLDRYRIVGPIGRGGMGEVFRADDLTLEQPVALKFLPRALENDPERLERLYSEVRLARQVSHPAVCRVWDVGEADGQPFLSMEFVDGENLSSLLRRIGRLPVDKAIDIARQVASGLAAAHEKGVLHRDLKPSNVMLDGQGKVRLTDFGLAALDATLSGDDIRSGTPSYMSPEQLAGREVTLRSDIYALGLLLYELFTGRRAFDGRSVAELTRKHRDERPIEPSAIVPDLPAAVERTILACLEKAPKKRPPSAGAVLAMLSGQDPLAAAIAAGETPSPELVAAAGEQTVLRPAVAWACLAVVVIGALLAPVTQQWHALLARVPVERSPAALEDRARDLLARLGHDAPAADSAQGLSGDEEYLRRVAQTDPSPSRWDGLRTGEPPVLQYWYRQSPRPIAAHGLNGRVTASDPPATVSGMAGVRYDLRGRLVSLYAVTPQDESALPPAAAAAPDWSVLFAEAKLDPAAFKPVAAAVDATLLLRHAGGVGGLVAVAARRAGARRGGRVPRQAGVVPDREPVDARRARPAVRPDARASACRWGCFSASSPCCSSAGPCSRSGTCAWVAATAAAPRASRRRSSRWASRAGSSCATTSPIRSRRSSPRPAAPASPPCSPASCGSSTSPSSRTCGASGRGRSCRGRASSTAACATRSSGVTCSSAPPGASS